MCTKMSHLEGRSITCFQERKKLIENLENKADKTCCGTKTEIQSFSKILTSDKGLLEDAMRRLEKIGVHEGDYKSISDVSPTGPWIYLNGDVTTGQYLDDKRHGIACNVSSSGDVYYGEFVNDKMSGQGCFLSKRGQHYKGGW
jgi:hypothetical protein